MDAILEPLVNSPSMLRYLEQLKEIAQAEQQRRERFYEEITPSDKWEFINGEVVMSSPATVLHNEIRERLASIVGIYVVLHELGFAVGEKMMISLTRNDYEPDYVFFGVAKAAAIRPEQMRLSAPDLAVEILSKSTHRTDRGVKFQDYAAHGVQEYWIIDPAAQAVEQYLLKDGNYELATKQVEGVICARVVAGLRLPVRGLFDNQECLRAVRAVLSDQPNPS